MTRETTEILAANHIPPKIRDMLLPSKRILRPEDAMANSPFDITDNE